MFEIEKAKSIAKCLYEKADKIDQGKAPYGRWDWVKESYTSTDMMRKQADEITAKLEAGEIPFKGLYAEPGGSVIDHALIEKDGVHHLFYIRGKAADSWEEEPTDDFGHAISYDLVNWEVKEPVLQTKKGEWDEYQVWAPHIIKHNDEYIMFYTGVNYNVAQAIGIAKSKDLYNWERYEGNPVIKPGEWGIWTEKSWSDCRDPMVLADGDKFYCYYCSLTFAPGRNRNVFCIGISSSEDLYNWKDEGCVILDKSFETPPESPFVVKKNDKYYLFYTDYKAGTVYAVSDDPVKGFKDVEDDKRVIKSDVSASEIYFTNGKWYFSYITHYPNQLHFFGIEELKMPE